MNKLCSECDAPLRSDNKSGLCRRCYHIWFQKTPAGRALGSQYNLARSVKKRAWLNTIKIEKGCTDCGYRAHPEALDFDHLPGTVKLFNVGYGGKTYSRERVLAEIDKCEVVCANCHRVRSATRGRRVIDHFAPSAP